jgi:hypothetical protein
MRREPCPDELGVEVEHLRGPCDLEALLRCHERPSFSSTPGAGRAFYPMHLCLLVGGRVEVDHVRDVVEVESPSRDVRHSGWFRSPDELA